MGHGFKVFIFQATKNGRGAARAWEDAVWSQFIELLEAVKEKGPIEGTPILRESRAQMDTGDEEEQEEGKNPPIFLLLGLESVSDNHVHFVVSAGYKGRHRDLVKGANRESIVDASANAHYRVDVWRSPNSAIALMAMETINGYCPQVLLRGHLQAVSRQEVMVDDPKKPGTKKRKGDYMGFKMVGHPDAEYLKRLVQDAEKASAVFQDTTVSARGQQKIVNAQLTLNLKTKDRVRSAVKTVNDWVNSLLGNEAVDGAVEQMKTEFGVDDEGLEKLDLDVDDVSLVLKPKGGSPRIYTPNHVRQLFDYPVTSYAPSNETYYAAVVPKVHNLSLKYDDCDFGIKTAREVSECLTGSI